MNTKVIRENIDEAAALIAKGALVAVPTETVYGLAGNGLDAEAVERIYEVKGCANAGCPSPRPRQTRPGRPAPRRRRRCSAILRVR